MQRMRVDLPQPLGPTMTTYSPSWTSKLTSHKASTGRPLTTNDLPRPDNEALILASEGTRVMSFPTLDEGHGQRLSRPDLPPKRMVRSKMTVVITVMINARTATSGTTPCTLFS